MGELSCCTSHVQPRDDGHRLRQEFCSSEHRKRRGNSPERVNLGRTLCPRPVDVKKSTRSRSLGGLPVSWCFCNVAGPTGLGLEFCMYPRLYVFL